MAHSIERLIENGVSGVIVLPMLGENASLSQKERDEVLDLSVARSGRRARAAAFRTGGDLDRRCGRHGQRNCQQRGVEGLMAFPSLAYKTDRRETVAWYKALAAASDLPIMIYNNPIAYKVDVDVADARGPAPTSTRSSASRRRPATSAASPISTTPSATASPCSAASTT